MAFCAAAELARVCFAHPCCGASPGDMGAAVCALCAQARAAARHGWCIGKCTRSAAASHGAHGPGPCRWAGRLCSSSCARGASSGILAIAGGITGAGHHRHSPLRHQLLQWGTTSTARSPQLPLGCGSTHHPTRAQHPAAPCSPARSRQRHARVAAPQPAARAAPRPCRPAQRRCAGSLTPSAPRRPAPRCCRPRRSWARAPGPPWTAAATAATQTWPLHTNTQRQARTKRTRTRAHAAHAGVTQAHARRRRLRQAGSRTPCECSSPAAVSARRAPATPTARQWQDGTGRAGMPATRAH